MQCRAFISHWDTHSFRHRGVHTLTLAPAEICLHWQCSVWLITMQFCRKVLCKPCSARVTSPEEDMEYKMGSCIGISHRQVNRGEGGCWAEAVCSVASMAVWLSSESVELEMLYVLLVKSWVLLRQREKVYSSVGGGATSAGKRSCGDGKEGRSWEGDADCSEGRWPNNVK